MNLPLTNKVVLVTGGWRGIGAAISKKLVAQGARVVIHYAICTFIAVKLFAIFCDA